MNKQKLELTWIGKDKRPRLEPRIFLEDKGLSYQVPSTATSGESDVNRVFNDNLLIHGDNLLALKALGKGRTSGLHLHHTLFVRI